MFDSIEDHDIKNSVWISVFLIASTILIVLLGYWFWTTFTGQAFAIEYADEGDEALVSPISDDRPVVQVANATNIDGRAGEVTRRLRAQDFVGLEPFDIDDQPASVIYFKTDGLPRQDQANLVADHRF